MEMVVATKVTYKYLMNQSKHDLAQMVLDLLKKEEMQNNDLASVCRVSYHVFVDGVCAECGLTMRASDGAKWRCKDCGFESGVEYAICVKCKSPRR